MSREKLTIYRKTSIFERPLVYICSRYRGKNKSQIRANIKEAIELGKAIYAQGYAPVIPHINSWAVFGLTGGSDIDIVEFDINLLSKCSALVANLNHLGDVSEGMQFEIDYCKKTGIPVYWISKTNCSSLDI